MGEKTAISWTDATANFWIGCNKVSEACQFCYAERDMKVYGRDFGTVTRTKGAWIDILNRKKYPPGTKVFLSSWTDFWHPAADEWRDEAFDILRQRDDLTLQFLTKRIERVADHLPPDWPWPNAWLGATVENQRRADERIPYLLQIPAAVHFVSCEPLLGPLDLTKWLHLNQVRGSEIPWPTGTVHGVTDPPKRFSARFEPRIDWVITGGESGPNARPSHPDWFRSLRDQCQAAGVAFHFKQWGEWIPFYDRDREDPDWRNCPKCAPNERYLNLAGGFGFHGERVVCVRRVGAKKAGRLLDGKVWDEMPARTQ